MKKKTKKKVNQNTEKNNNIKNIILIVGVVLVVIIVFLLSTKMGPKGNNVINNFSISEFENVTAVGLGEYKASFAHEGNSIFFFCSNEEEKCYDMLKDLNKVAKDNEVMIEYLNVLELRSAFKVTDGVLTKTKDGSASYYKILNLLNDELEDFYVEDKEGKKYNTNEKRLYAPTLVAVKDGKVTSLHVSTLDSQASGYDKLSNDQIKELEKIVSKLIASKNVEVCTNDKC